MIRSVGALAGGDRALVLVDQQSLQGRRTAIDAEIIHAALVAENLACGKERARSGQPAGWHAAIQPGRRRHAPAAIAGALANAALENVAQAA